MSDQRDQSSHRRNPAANPENPNIRKFINSLICRKWLALFPFFIISSLIITAGVYLPKIYQASTTFLFVPSQVSKDFLRPMLESSMESQILNLSKEIKSRRQIKQIIKEFHLDEGITDPEKLESMISGLQKVINVEVTKREACKISLEGRNPLLITQIINRIATITVESQQKDSLQKAETATSFLSRELEKVEREMREQESKLQEFKQAHLNELPEQKDYNLRMVDRLQLQLQNNEQTLKTAQDQKQVMEKQLVNLQSALVKGIAASPNNPLQTDYARLKGRT